MAQERVFTYYLEPTGDPAHTNKVFQENLGEENALEGVICSDGVQRNLYRCVAEMVKKFWLSKASLAIDFKIFCQEGHGQIRDITNWYKKIHRKRPATTREKS